MAVVVSTINSRAASRTAAEFRRAPNAIDVGGAGHDISVNWPPAAGATKAVVDLASAEIGPEWAEKQYPDLLAGACSNADHAELAVPAGWRLRNVTLTGLKLRTPEGVVDITGEDMHGVRLVVSIPGLPPLYTVPAVGGRGMLPASLTGASLSTPKAGGPGVLTLPFLPGPRIRLALVKGDTPDKFEPQLMDLASAPSQCFIPPRNLKLLAPDGSAAWAFPNEMPVTTPNAIADYGTLLEKTLNDKLKAGQPLSAKFTLKGDDPSSILFWQNRVTGALIHEVSGVRSATLQGDLAMLDLGGPLDPIAPAFAIGDLTVKYLGIRILETVSDLFPSPNEAIGGTIVKETPLVRTLPPQALAEFPVARIGLVGRAPVECELSIQMVELHDGTPGAPLGTTVILKLKPSEQISTCWFELPKSPAPTVSVGFSVQATKGRFFWVARENPLVRIAVFDPDPGNRPLSLGGAKVLEVHESQSHLVGFNFPASAFTQSTPLLWDSSLFLKVDVSDLTLRYPR